MPTPAHGTTPEEWLLMSDQQLLGSCEVDLFRASGPGGQKRNKTSSAVRLRHAPTGLIVTAVESRSQHENRARAVKRLREAVALRCRSPWSQVRPHPPYFARALERSPGLHIRAKEPDYLLIVHHVLDVFAACGAGAAEAAARLGISTGQLVRLLKADEKLLQEANQMRAARGLHALR